MGEEGFSIIKSVLYSNDFFFLRKLHLCYNEGLPLKFQISGLLKNAEVATTDGPGQVSTQALIYFLFFMFICCSKVTF